MSVRQSKRSRHRRLADFEMLEDRRVCAVTAEEQYFIYRNNYARANPVRYQTERSLSVDLSYVTPRGPLAVIDSLFASAEAKVNDMANLNYFAHNSPNNVNANLLVRNNGYALPAQMPVSGTTYIFSDNGNSVESLAAGTTTADAALEALIVDAGVNPPGHRNHLLGIKAPSTVYNEIGVGYRYQAGTTYSHYWAIHSAARDPGQLYVTGVVYNDVDNDSLYDQGEGLSGVTVDIPATGQTTVTNAAGGWSIPVAAGDYEIRAAGGTFSGTSTVPVRVSSQNLEVDFRSGKPYGQISFENWINTAPTLNTTPSPTLGPVFLLSSVPISGTPVASLISGAISDPDPVPKRGIAIHGSTTAGGGKWQFDAGAGWTDLPAVSNSAALLLRETDLVRFVPGSQLGSYNLSFRAWDQVTGTAGATVNLTTGTGGTTAFSSQSDTATVHVLISTNTPTLTPTNNRTLPTIAEDSTNPAGTQVSTILGSTASDLDTGTRFGMAVSGFTGAGSWQYSTNSGLAWQDFTSLSGTDVLLLRDADLLRFVPAAHFVGTASITYYAWDQSYGVTGTIVNRTAAPPTDHQSAFSIANDTARITITPVNDAPTLLANYQPWLNPVAAGALFSNTGGTLVSEILGQSFNDLDAGALRGIAITATTGSGTFYYQNDGSWRSGGVDNSYAWLLKSTDRVQFVPSVGFTGNATFTYRGWDQTTGPETSGIWADVSSASRYGGTKAYSVEMQTGSVFVGAAGTQPTLSSITLLDPNPPTEQSARFALTFSESVANVTAADFTLAKAGSANGVIESVIGSGNSYIVTLSQLAGSGRIGLALDSNNDIRDSVGNRLALTPPGTNQQYDLASSRLHVSLPQTLLAENAANPLTGTVVLDETAANNIVISLSSSDVSEAIVPATVTILAGQQSVIFILSAVNDSLLDGSQPVTITASAVGYVSGTTDIAVTDHETLALNAIAATLSENSGSSTITVTRSNIDLTTSLTVNLNNSLPSALAIPTQVVIPSGQASTTFIATAVDDTVLDGNQFAQITASAAGYFDGSTTVTVTDHETLTLSINPTSLSESGGTATATIRRNNTDLTSALLVTLFNGNSAEVSLPTEVTIPSGAAQATFAISAIDDNLLDGSTLVNIAASASGYVGSSADLTVISDDISWQNTNRYDVNADLIIDIQDVLAVIFYFNNGTLGPIPSGSPPTQFYDVNGDRQFDIQDVLAVIFGFNLTFNGSGEATNETPSPATRSEATNDLVDQAVLELLAWELAEERE